MPQQERNWYYAQHVGVECLGAVRISRQSGTVPGASYSISCTPRDGNGGPRILSVALGCSLLSPTSVPVLAPVPKLLLEGCYRERIGLGH